MKYLVTLFALLFSVSTFAADTDEPTLADFGPQQKFFEATDVFTIETTSFMEGTTVASIMGQVIGMEYAPAGDYRVRITNGKNYKAPRFYTMWCTIKSYIEDMDAAIEEDNVAVLSTAWTDKTGNTHNNLGYYSGAMAIPSDGYKVIILNGKNKQFWNSMNCRIK